MLFKLSLPTSLALLCVVPAAFAGVIRRDDALMDQRANHPHPHPSQHVTTLTVTVTKGIPRPSDTTSYGKFTTVKTKTVIPTTTTRAWTGTGTTTVTGTLKSGHHRYTDIVETPAIPTTTTEAWSGSYTTTYTEPLKSGHHRYTVVVETPSTPATIETTTTKTKAWTGSYATTKTRVSKTGATIETVIVKTPSTTGAIGTTTIGYTGSTTLTTTSTGTATTEVYVETPYSTVTTTEAYTGTVTTTITTILPTGTSGTATVVVETPAPTVDCNRFGYLIQTGGLYQVDLTTGTFDLINSNVSDRATAVPNALAYNSVDNYLYATQEEDDDTNSYVLRIDADGDSTVIGEIPSTTEYFSGDVTASGDYYVYNGNTNAWAEIDLTSTNSTTYGQVIASGTSTAGPAQIADWAVVLEGGDYLYAVSSSSTETNSLWKWSTVDHTWTEVAAYSTTDLPVDGLYGAAYSGGDGYFYVENNDSGDIYRINIDGSTPVLVTTGPTSAKNDGARCINAPAA